MRYEVLTYGRPELRCKTHAVEKITDEIRRMVKDMLITMHSHEGVGLAATQIGRTESLCVIEVPPAKDEQGRIVDENPGIAMPLVMLNPEITMMRGEETCKEGCLSLPEISVNITRAAEVTVSYMDVHEKAHSIQTRGLLARAVQHEVDHLNGVLLVDRMSAVQRVAVAGKLKKLKKEAAE